MFSITDEQVRAYLGQPPASDDDAANLTLAAKAAAEWVVGNAPLPASMADWNAEPTSALQLGAVMLAARWYHRRTSPLGVAAFSDMGVAMVVRQDPDVAQLLGLGKPKVG